MKKQQRSSPLSIGQIRIIGGQWRGRKLQVIDSPGLRPTTDRVKETVFNWLMPVLSDARCLDCFAGSGALGMEALSRYAREVVFLEAKRQVFQQLLKNSEGLNVNNAQIICTDALQWLAQNGSPFDVVFLDPPYRQGLLAETISHLEQNEWLADEAWVYIECEIDHGELPLLIPDNWRLHREKIAGQVAYRLYHRQKREKD